VNPGRTQLKGTGLRLVDLGRDSAHGLWPTPLRVADIRQQGFQVVAVGHRSGRAAFGAVAGRQTLAEKSEDELGEGIGLLNGCRRSGVVSHVVPGSIKLVGSSAVAFRHGL
jgi:hypothetical protein